MTMIDLKTIWIEALRSGKYKQGKGRLRDNHDCYCCLGVLADIVGVEWTKDSEKPWLCDEEKEALEAGYAFTVSFDEPGFWWGTLPYSLRAKTGINNRDESVLVNMNDDLDKTFTEIADFIEKL